MDIRSQQLLPLGYIRQSKVQHYCEERIEKSIVSQRGQLTSLCFYILYIGRSNYDRSTRSDGQVVQRGEHTTFRLETINIARQKHEGAGGSVAAVFSTNQQAAFLSGGRAYIPPSPRFSSFIVSSLKSQDGPYQANRPQVYRRKGSSQAAGHQGRSQVRPRHRRRQEAPQVQARYRGSP